MEMELAEIAGDGLRVVMRAAPPRTLHSGESWRIDGNCPALTDRDGTTVFYSVYEPHGRTYRRRYDRAFRSVADSDPVRLLGDPDPQNPKWIEAVWRSSTGRLYGWYHAEEIAPCAIRLDVPHIGEAVSDDDGLTWQRRGTLLRAPGGQIDCSRLNGFVAGGFGDLCVVPDRSGGYLYMAFSSYVVDECAQGVGMARLSAARDGPPAHGLELWTREGWQPASAGGLPKPLWPMVRNWRHADPDGFWGPAVHYNRALGAYVMLLNHTAGGAGDLLQEGIYLSTNRFVDRPHAWTMPMQIVRGGAWYPQVIGLEEGCGDAEAGASARFFMAGFSAWEIDFSISHDAGYVRRPLHLTKADFARLFGADRRSPW